MIKILRASYIVILLTAVSYINAQTGNPSIYTGFGIGRINSEGTVTNENLGGSGVALGSNGFINTLNPASLSQVDSLNMLIDVGLGGGMTYYSDGEDDGTSFYGGLRNITLAMRATRWSGLAFGFNQYSYIGYNINTYVDVAGSNGEQVYKVYSGDGGVNQVHLTYGFRIGKNLSLGAKGSFLFGTVEKTETYAGSNIGGSLLVDYTDYLHMFGIEGGMQYKFKINKTRFGIGATYMPNMKFTTDRDVLASSSSGAGVSEELDDNYYKLPDSYVAGLTMATSKGLKFVLDGKYQKWSDIEYSDSKTGIQDSYRLSAGAEYFNLKSEKMMPFKWQFGGYFERSYLIVDSRSIIDRGINVGLSIPLKPKNAYDSRGFVNVGLNLGQRGSWGNSLITESYAGLNVSVSLVEIWFMKRQIE